MEAEELSSLVAAAASGEDRAWGRLIDHFGGLVWSIAGAYGLGRADAADVAQVTWLRLVEHLGRLRDPSRVGAWLVTTARRECLRLLRTANREIVSDEDGRFERGRPITPSPESQLLQKERASLVWRSFRQLGSRCQELLRALLFAHPAMSYDQVAEAFGMPIGSIGPTRARCLEQLRRKLGSDVSLAD